MFLKSHTDVAVRFVVVRDVLVRCPTGWLGEAALDTKQHAEQLLVDVGLDALLGMGRSGQRVHVDVGEAISTDRLASLPIRLRVEEGGRVVRSLDGSLDAAWLGSDRTHLALSAQYDLPVAMFEGYLDRALLHRVAESASQRFVETAAQHFVETAAHRPRR
jgi:hypothetical protein